MLKLIRYFKYIFKEESPEDIHCPVCGYFCLGNGGNGCIDKPFLCGLSK